MAPCTAAGQPLWCSKSHCGRTLGPGCRAAANLASEATMVSTTSSTWRTAGAAGTACQTFGLNRYSAAPAPSRPNTPVPTQTPSPPCNTTPTPTAPQTSHLVVRRHARRQQQAVERALRDARVACAVEHHGDSCQRGAPHQAKHVALQGLVGCTAGKAGTAGAAGRLASAVPRAHVRGRTPGAPSLTVQPRHTPSPPALTGGAPQHLAARPPRVQGQLVPKHRGQLVRGALCE